MKRAPALAVLTILTSFATVAQAADLTASREDLAVIRQRMVDSLLPAAREADYLVRRAREQIPTMTPDHAWPDVKYADQARSAWLARTHLDRALLLAKAYAITARDKHPDPALAAACADALSYWIQHDPHNPNWWWNEIGVPQLTGETVLLLGPACPPAVRDGVVNILKRSVWTKWTGQNLVWGVGNQIVRGLITDDAPLVAAAFARMYQEVVVSPKEGIQIDYSFHQHGDQFYSGGYGLGFANDVGRYVAFAWGTGCQAPSDTLAVFDHYMLDGEAWMTWGPLFDYSALGREITRKGKVAVPSDWTGGPIVPVGAAYGLGRTASLLAQLPVPRQQEYASFAKRLLSLPASDPSVALSGHKHFWRSDYTSHRRPGYFFSVKMFSTRLQNAELTNEEGKKSHHLGDGNTFLYLTGNEYRDIFPVWDWTMLPGTTAELSGDLNKLLPGGNRARGKTDFVGGVSDGAYGATAMLLHRGSLSANKSWFFLDDEIVCLGSSITCPSDNAIATTVNQCFLKGPVTQDPSHAWVHHDNVGYVFPVSQDVKLTAGPQSGAWSDIGTGSSTKETADVFKLWVAHTPHSTGGTYSYILLPNATAEQTKDRSARPDVEILAQSDAAHAVRHAKLDLTAVVFFAAGKVANIEVDQPCILMIRGDRLTVCNPENHPSLVNVTVNGTKYAVQCPDGPLAGSSVTIPLHP